MEYLPTIMAFSGLGLVLLTTFVWAGVYTIKGTCPKIEPIVVAVAVGVSLMCAGLFSVSELKEFATWILAAVFAILVLIVWGIWIDS